MPARLSAFFVWALVAATATFWGLRLFVTGPGAPAHAIAVMDSAPAHVDLTRLLGAPPVTPTVSVQAPALSSRFVLTGVMAPKRAGDPGIALIAVDGKFPRAFHVGGWIDNELVLQSVSLRSASIGPPRGNAPSVVLEMPPLAAAATGVLPPPASMAPPPAPTGLPPTTVPPAGGLPSATTGVTPPAAGSMPQAGVPPSPGTAVAPPVPPATPMPSFTPVPSVAPMSQQPPSPQAPSPTAPARRGRGLGGAVLDQTGDPSSR